MGLSGGLSCHYGGSNAALYPDQTLAHELAQGPVRGPYRDLVESSDLLDGGQLSADSEDALSDRRPVGVRHQLVGRQLVFINRQVKLMNSDGILPRDR
jgi:hypothetical protein